jgi:hypothetical protein
MRACDHLMFYATLNIINFVGARCVAVFQQAGSSTNSVHALCTLRCSVIDRQRAAAAEVEIEAERSIRTLAAGMVLLVLDCLQLPGCRFAQRNILCFWEGLIVDWLGRHP